LLAGIPTRGTSSGAPNRGLCQGASICYEAFYSNLLMGEFERSGIGQKKGVAGAIADVFTAANFGIAMVAALIGYSLFEFLRKKF
jgi:hypothetical protein